jgi:hypothetical protein
MTSVSGFIARIDRASCARLLLTVHYAHRWPSITHAFGLFMDGVLVGCVTYGTPPSSTLRNGIAGEEFAGSVLELNRLVLDHNLKNEASRLVSTSLRMIGGDHIIVSFADTEQGHRGVVYQACSFTYHGLSAKRTDWKVRGMEHLHGITIADQFRGVKNRAQAMRDKYGDDFYLKPRPRKHRYIKIIGSKGFRVKAARAIKYEKMPYPKLLCVSKNNDLTETLQ